MSAFAFRARHVVAPVSLLALAACSASGGPSVSGTAEESAQAGTGSQSLWERVRSLSFDSGKTIEMSATGIIAEAFIEEAQTRGVDGNVAADLCLDAVGQEWLPIDRKLGLVLDQSKRDYEKLNAEQRERVMMDLPHITAELPLLVALQSRKGWEVQAIDDRKVDPAFDTPFFRQNRKAPTYNPDLHRRYMEMLAISAIFSNEVFGEIASQLDGVRLADPEAAKKRVIDIYKAIPADRLMKRLSEISRQVEAGRFSVDLTGSGNIHFTHTMGDFVGDARGMTWTKGGGVWFGDGKMNGQSVSFRLASTSTLNQREAQSGTATTGDDAKVSGSGSIGPVR
jgi:hypothetical protein